MAVFRLYQMPLATLNTYLFEYRYGTVSEAVDIFLSKRTEKPISLDRYAWSTIGPDWTAMLGELCPQ